MFRNLCTGLAILSSVCIVCRGDDQATPDAAPPVEVDGADVKGRPQQDLVKVANARYFVWFDGQGWHLRTAAKGLTKFSGSIRLEDGSFIKLRPIGLDPKARNPDRWGINDDRTEIQFELKTAGSFDGFDFDIRRLRADPKITFDLKLGTNDLKRPKRIFLGRDSRNPAGSHFTCPAAPDAIRPAKEAPI